LLAPALEPALLEPETPTPPLPPPLGDAPDAPALGDTLPPTLAPTLVSAPPLLVSDEPEQATQ